MFPGSNTVGRDASGNQISLLNDNPVPQTNQNPIIREPILTSAASYYPSIHITTPYPSMSLPSASPTPEMPGFLCSDTYDWQGHYEIWHFTHSRTSPIVGTWDAAVLHCIVAQVRQRGTPPLLSLSPRSPTAYGTFTPSHCGPQRFCILQRLLCEVYPGGKT